MYAAKCSFDFGLYFTIFIIHKQFIGVNMDCSRKKHMLFDDPLDLHLAEKQVLPAKRAFLFLATVFPG